MARRKRKMKRSGKIAVLVFIFAYLAAAGLCYAFSNAAGKFDIKTFVILLFIFSSVFGAAAIVFSIPAVKGKIGESKVSSRLKKLAKKYGGYVFNNIIVPGEDDKTSQIDHIYVCKYGIYVVETKNYAGRIYGDESQKNWIQVLAYGNSKNKLYNPVKQNQTHVIRLKEYLNLNFDPVSVVVFIRANLNNVKSDHVYYLGDIRYLLGDAKRIMPDNIVEDIAAEISYLKNNPCKTNRQHVKEIKQMKKDIDDFVCPRCGGALVLRKGPSGTFYGCSNYPDCKFTKKN